MFTEALLLAVVQVIGTFLTFGLKSGSKKRKTMKTSIFIIRRIQIIDIISSIAFGIYGSLSGTAIGAATAVASGLVNTILLQLIKLHLEMRYEVIWSIEYHIVYSEKEKDKIKEKYKPEYQLPEAISLYKQFGLKDEIVQEAVDRYNGPINTRISKDDRVFVGKTISEWQELKVGFREEAKKKIPETASKAAEGIGRLAINTTISILKGIGRAGKNAYKSRKGGHK